MVCTFVYLGVLQVSRGLGYSPSIWPCLDLELYPRMDPCDAGTQELLLSLGHC